MSELSPSQRELEARTLCLFPDGESDEQGVLVPSVVAARPELQVQLHLRDVRLETGDAARTWFERAWQLAEPMCRFAWFTLHLALVRHAVLVGERERARVRARELVEQLYERPSVEITNQDSYLRDALRRAQRALRAPILARTIKLDIGDHVPRIIELAQSDRTCDDRTRLEVLRKLVGGLRTLRIDEAPIAELLVAAGSTPDSYRSKQHGRWFVRETSKEYLTRPIYEFDRVPQELHWRRMNNNDVRIAADEY